MIKANHFQTVMLYLGSQDGAYFRIDPQVNHLIWMDELYSRIPSEKESILVHVRTAVMRIVKQRQLSLLQVFHDFLKWFCNQHKNDAENNPTLDHDLIALFKSIVDRGIAVDSIFPEINCKT